MKRVLFLMAALCVIALLVRAQGPPPIPSYYTGSQLNLLAFSTAPAIDLTKGTIIQFPCSTASSSIVPTISNLNYRNEFTVIFVQNGTTACTWTWPASIHGAVSVSATLGSVSVERFVVSANGTDAYLSSSVVGTTGGTP